jgi:limonene-1,2-epoxide hydrolase
MTNTYSFRDDLIVRMEWGVPTAGVLPPETLVERLLEAFNSKNAAAVIALMHPHVDWPDLFGPDRLKGRQAVQAMWTYRFERWNPHVSLLEMTTDADGRVHARVAYSIHHLDGRLWFEQTLMHHVDFRDGFIAKMTAEPA